MEARILVIDVVWNSEIPRFIQHRHRKMQKTVRNVVWIIDFKQFIQRSFENLHISLYDSQKKLESYNIVPCFLQFSGPPKGNVVISFRKIKIIQHRPHVPLAGESFRCGGTSYYFKYDLTDDRITHIIQLIKPYYLSNTV